MNRLDNPYESPRTDGKSENVSIHYPRAWHTILYGIGGAFFGYIMLTILANMEVWQFYTIRSTLTGESGMSQIVSHPADRWIVLGLFIVFVFGGACAGFWCARRKS